MKKNLGRFIMVLLFSSLFFMASCSCKQDEAELLAQQQAIAEQERLEEEMRLEAEKMEAEERARIEAERLAAESRSSADFEAARAAALAAFVEYHVYFGHDSTALTPETIALLDDKVAWMRANPDAKIIIEGHCDERGTREYNLALGERRAQVGKKYMVDSGIEADRISTISYGKERPLDPGHNEAAWAKNRRIQAVIR